MANSPSLPFQGMGIKRNRRNLRRHWNEAKLPDEIQKHDSLFDLADLQSIEAARFEKNGKPYLKYLATDKDRPA